jgi:hypothetical protein
MENPVKVPSAKKNHFYLVAGMVIFNIEGDGEGQTRSHMLNTMIKSPENQGTLERLGRAQQAIQMRLAGILGEDAAKSTVVDVVIMSISYMGYMSDKEFDPRQEVTNPAPQAVQ